MMNCPQPYNDSFHDPFNFVAGYRSFSPQSLPQCLKDDLRLDSDCGWDKVDHLPNKRGVVEQLLHFESCLNKGQLSDLSSPQLSLLTTNCSGFIHIIQGLPDILSNFGSLRS